MQEGVSTTNGTCKQGHDGNKVGGLDPGLSTTGHGEIRGELTQSLTAGLPPGNTCLRRMKPRSSPGKVVAIPKSLFDSQPVLEHINTS